jgi:hypothetical protein
MFLRLIRYVLAAALMIIGTYALAQDRLPPPVNGVTFEEWAAGSARLANNQPLADVLKVLNVDQATWNKTNELFIEALRKGDPASYMYRRYAEVFSNPSVGRFKGRSDQPELEGKLATFEDYARVQADLTVGSEFGKDPQEILKAHNLTVYEFSQEAGNWVKVMAQVAGSGDNERLARMDRIREKFEAEYRARYKGGASD